MSKSYQVVITRHDGQLMQVKNGFDLQSKGVEWAQENYDAVINWQSNYPYGGIVAQARDTDMQFKFRIYVVEENYDKE